MAKAKKQKNNEEDKKTDTNQAIVKHQKLCLSIDMDKRQVYGYTELQIEVPKNGIVALHADNLVIEAVTVDGEPARSEIFPHFVPVDSDNRWCGVSSASAAADAAGSVYFSTLERELVPNLLIMCPKPDVSVTGQQENSENGLNSSEETKKNTHGTKSMAFCATNAPDLTIPAFYAYNKQEMLEGLYWVQNLKLVRVDYWVEKAETGIHFEGDVLHTDNQIRRARCWFPCIDDNTQSCCYDLEFTVAENFVAVSTGDLLCQVLSEDGLRKTYVYKVNVPVACRWISLAVAPFEIISDSHTGLLSYICLKDSLEKLQNTIGFFHSAFSYYEEYLSSSFPFGSYTQVFLSPDTAISPMSLGASMTIFSSKYLYDEKIIDQTIDTRIRLAFALARQWFGVYVSSEETNDDWLLDGLAWFLTDLFVKQFLGNNEARYRRYKANLAVCKADDSGATALSSPASSVNLYGTQSIGFYRKMRSWKSVAVLQMLEKQMGPEAFRKILQTIMSRAQDPNRPLRTLSTTEFRHLANKVGNLERPFLKEFFPRWVGSCGCPVLRMGFSYNKRKNWVELAAMRGCTATSDSIVAVANGNPGTEKEVNVGWPGMMSIRVHELDGMYDHPILPMTGEAWQLLEMQCHSKLAARRFQKSKRGSKPDGSDENGDVVSAADVRSNSDSALLWLRADPEMEYLADINFNQPVQMWINQLERDKDVVAQSQAITMLGKLPQLSFSVINTLSNFLGDAKTFWRVRIEAAFALAITATEESDWAGLLHLIKYYKSRRFDANIGLPKPNDFHDFPEYFVLEAIPNAVAMVRSSDKKSPREAVEFVLQLLKYNDNNGNPYSDVFWLASLVQSIGELEFGQQSIPFLSSLLKRIDRLLQFDRLMPSYNGILTMSCIRTLTQIALKLSNFIPLDRVINLIRPFRDLKIMWQVRIEACKSLLDLEFHCKGFDAVLTLFMRYIDDEPTLRGQVKIGVHVTRLCQMRSGTHSIDDIKSDTLKALLCLLESPLAFNNVILRHYLFCVLQVLAGRPPTLHGVPRNETSQMGQAEMINFFAALMSQPKHFDPMFHDPNSSDMAFMEDNPYNSVVDPTVDLSNNLMQQAPVAGIKVSEPEPTQNVPELSHLDLTVDPPINLSEQEHIAGVVNLEPEPLPNVPNILHKDPASDNLNPTVQQSPLTILNESHVFLVKSEALEKVDTIPDKDHTSENLNPHPSQPETSIEIINESHVGLVIPEAPKELDIIQQKDPNSDYLNPTPMETSLRVLDESFKDLVIPETPKGVETIPHKDPTSENLNPTLVETSLGFLDESQKGLAISEVHKEVETIPLKDLTSGNPNPTLPETSPRILNESHRSLVIPEAPKSLVIPEAPKEGYTVSNSRKQRRVLKFKVRHSASSSKAGPDNPTVERSHDTGPVASSSVSVDAPQKLLTKAVSVSNQNLEEVNSCHDPGSRMTASIGSAKLANEGDELGKELQCTADSSNILKDNGGAKTQKYVSLQTLSVSGNDHAEEKGKKKEKEKKRKRDKDKSHRDDPEYREKKRVKKEKKKEKKMAKLLSAEVHSGKVKLEPHFLKIGEEKQDKIGIKLKVKSEKIEEVKKGEIRTRLKLVTKESKQVPVRLTPVVGQEQGTKMDTIELETDSVAPKVVTKMAESRADPSEASSSRKIRIKLNRPMPNKE